MKIGLTRVADQFTYTMFFDRILEFSVVFLTQGIVKVTESFVALQLLNLINSFPTHKYMAEHNEHIEHNDVVQ